MARATEEATDSVISSLYITVKSDPVWLRAEQCFLRTQKKKKVTGNPRARWGWGAAVSPKGPVPCIWRTIWLCQPLEKREEISFGNLDRGRTKEPVLGDGWGWEKVKAVQLHKYWAFAPPTYHEYTI